MVDLILCLLIFSAPVVVIVFFAAWLDKLDR